MTTIYHASRIDMTYDRTETVSVELDGYVVRLRRDETSASVFVVPTAAEPAEDNEALDALLLTADVLGDEYGLSWHGTHYNEELPDYDLRTAVAVEGLRLMENALAGPPSTSRMCTAARKAAEVLRRARRLGPVTLASAARETADAVMSKRIPFLDPRDATWQWGWDRACEAVAAHLDGIAAGAATKGPDHVGPALRAAASAARDMQPTPSWAWGEKSPDGWRDGLAAIVAYLEERAGQFDRQGQRIPLGA